MLSNYISKKSFKNHDGKNIFNKYEYKSGKEILSCVNIYVIDLMYKIQSACGPESLVELKKKIYI